MDVCCGRVLGSLPVLVVLLVGMDETGVVVLVLVVVGPVVELAERAAGVVV